MKFSIPMGYAPKRFRPAWEDRFTTPTPGELREGLNQEHSGLLEAARERLLGHPGTIENVRWQGLPWRWTLTYCIGSDAGKPWAYLVPDPTAPKLAIPLSMGVVGSLPLARMKKHVRDAVLQSRLVDGVYWAQWDITSKSQLGEIFELADHSQRATDKPQKPSSSKARPTKPNGKAKR